MPDIRDDLGQVSGIMFAALFAFGFAYNLLVDYLEKHHLAEGFTSLLVVGGVAVTIVALAFFSWQWALTTFLAFSASGTPMVLGSLWRYAKAREAGRKAHTDGDKAA